MLPPQPPWADRPSGSARFGQTRYIYAGSKALYLLGCFFTSICQYMYFSEHMLFLLDLFNDSASATCVLYMLRWSGEPQIQLMDHLDMGCPWSFHFESDHFIRMSFIPQTSTKGGEMTGRLSFNASINEPIQLPATGQWSIDRERRTLYDPNPVP